MAQPWYTFSWLGNFGSIDPQGNYYKPDVNVQAPGYAPITALLPGTVTSVQNTSFGQTTITVKLDQAINSLASHTFYEHMSSANVQVGQHVSAGTLLGYNNPPGQVPIGFGFYSGDVYGSGSAWQILQQDLAPGGKGLLNPLKVFGVPDNGTLNNANLNAVQSTSGVGTGGPSTSTNVCDALVIGGLICSTWFEQAIFVTVGILVALVAIVSISTSRKSST